MIETQQCQAYIDSLKKNECPDSTYGFFNPPLVMDRALGSQIKTVSGHILTDLCAGFGVLALGHNHPRILARLDRKGSQDWPAVMHGMGDVYPSRSKVEFFEYVKTLLPNTLARGALALSGSQAVEIAIKTAILHTGNAGFLTVDGGYHGLDLGTLSMCTQSPFREPFKRYLSSAGVSVPTESPSDVIDAAIKHLIDQGFGFAGVIVEPIQGRAGVKPLDRPWLQKLFERARAHGALVILDEVFCGLGRAGLMTFATEFEVDLTCLGKALGGGLPLSLCIGSESVMRSWPESQGEALHTGTFFGHPLACELAVETLKVIDESDLCHRAQNLGHRALEYLTERLSPRGIVVRGQGLMIGIDYKEHLGGLKVMNQLRKEGVLALVSGADGACLSVTPALNIPEDLLWPALEKVVDLSLKASVLETC